MKPTLLVADDHALIRSGLRAQFELLGRFSVLEAWDYTSLQQVVRQTAQIDLALIDAVMPGTASPQWLVEFCDAWPDLAVLVVTGHTPAGIQHQLRARPNVRGWVHKTQPAEQLRAAVDLALAGQPAWFLGDVTGMDAMPPLPHGARALSGRMLQVAQLVAQGLSNQDVAQSLGLTEGTVKNYLKDIFRQLGVANRTQLALRLKTNDS